jgi:hypothetical protein
VSFADFDEHLARLEVSEMQQLVRRAAWTDLRDWTDGATCPGGWELAEPDYVSIEVLR